MSLNVFFNILQQTKNHSNKHFRILPIIVNKRTHNLFSEQKCKSKWSNGSTVRNFIRKWNTLPIAIRRDVEDQISNTFFKIILRLKFKKSLIYNFLRCNINQDDVLIYRCLKKTEKLLLKSKSDNS